MKIKPTQWLETVIIQFEKSIKTFYVKKSNGLALHLKSILKVVWSMPWRKCSPILILTLAIIQGLESFTFNNSISIKVVNTPSRIADTTSKCTLSTNPDTLRIILNWLLSLFFLIHLNTLQYWKMMKRKCLTNSLTAYNGIKLKVKWPLRKYLSKISWIFLILKIDMSIKDLLPRHHVRPMYIGTSSLLSIQSHLTTLCCT